MQKAAKRLLRAVDRSVALSDEIRQARDALDQAIRNTDEKQAVQAPVGTGDSA